MTQDDVDNDDDDDDDDENETMPSGRPIAALTGTDRRTVDKRGPCAENGDGRVEQREQEAGDDQHQADGAAVALAEHRPQPTDHTSQQPSLGLRRRRRLGRIRLRAITKHITRRAYFRSCGSVT